MTTKSSFIRTYALAGGISLATVIGASGATVLTGLDDKNVAVPTDHGSNAAGTPNVSLNWVGDFDQYQNSLSPNVNTFPWTNDTTGVGVYQLDSAAASKVWSIAFSPDAGFGVVLNSIDVNVFDGGNNFELTWDVSDSGTSLGSGSFTATGSANSTLSLGDITGANNETLTLTLTAVNLNGTAGSYQAIDNITFDQVPEPSTSLLAAAGLGAMALRRRRK